MQNLYTLLVNVYFSLYLCRLNTSLYRKRNIIKTKYYYEKIIIVDFVVLIDKHLCWLF